MHINISAFFLISSYILYQGRSQKKWGHFGVQYIDRAWAYLYAFIGFYNSNEFMWGLNPETR